MARVEDPRLLTGRGSYVDDVTVPGMLHAHFVRSPFAHAHVRGIDVEEARRHPGVVAVYTGADIEALRTWGDRHAAPDGPPVLMVHDDCGEAVHSVPHCSHCGERLRRDHIHLEVGPGAAELPLLPAVSARVDASD